MIDMQGVQLTSEEVEMLQHPLTGGLILFSRNFESQQQVQHLCKSIRAAAGKPILIAVDQEGGRVQRFKEAFTTLPSMGKFRYLEEEQRSVLSKITQTGWLMASELITSGIDISFAPVLDVDIGVSKVIGDRGFSDTPAQIIDYSTAFISGMKRAGMSSTGKHFPGHGSTVADSHFELPIDERSMEEIRSSDMSVFKALSQNGLSAVMPAHVIYSSVDPLPACFSPYWLQTVLRKEINFSGAIFSDDLSMAGAKSMGDIESRAAEALNAGCDMILCCNDVKATATLLDKSPQVKNADKTARIAQMYANKSAYTFSELQLQESWIKANRIVSSIV